MVKRKSVGAESVDAAQPSTSKKAHRTGSSSSSSTGDEWLCASTRVPLPGETLSLPQVVTKGKRLPSTSASRRIGKAATRRLSAPSSASDLRKVDDTPNPESSLASCTTPANSSRRSSTGLFRMKKPSKLLELRRTSLPAPPTSKTSPRIRKTSADSTPEAVSKWPSFSSAQRRNVVFELSPGRAKSSISAGPSVSIHNESMEDTMEVEESPLKTGWDRPAESTPSPTKHPSVESVVADSQCSARAVRTRSLENSRRGAFHRIPARKEVTWPTPLRPAFAAPLAKSEISTNVVTQLVLDSSPDEKSEGSGSSTIKPGVVVSSVATRSSASGDVIAATQEFVTESDDEYHLRSEGYDIDEASRLHSNSASAEKRQEEEEQSNSEEDESSSDEDDAISWNSVARMNLTGVAREFAEYMLARRSERLMIKRDQNVATATYEILQTVSAWGLSVSWLSPKAVMFAPPFARDPATVTLALPILTIPNKYDPETPFILNPVIVSTTQEAAVPESVAV
ncbi:hypothetical protein Aduo_000242 [Ancylostoma duodenale]